MARHKKQEDETVEQTTTRQRLEIIANTATRGEKTSFDRKMDNMVVLLASLKPIEEQILDLMAKKMPIMDEIEVLRHDMVKSCVHPFPHLVSKNSVVHCKFCNRQFSVINQKSN